MKNECFQKKDKQRLFKRCLAFTLSLAVTLPTVVTGNISYDNSGSVYAATEDVVYGDVNSDSKIDLLDMLLLKSYVTDKSTDGFSVKSADLDGDGKISAKDVVELSMYLLNQTGSFSYEMNVDTDGDGLCDYVEKEMLKTDYQKKDTDGDRLDDYSEVYLCNTDPLSADTGKAGISDSLKDADGDKLTNAEEIKYGTSPSVIDTDEDGLDDYAEVSKHKTDPLKCDTDGDGISDNGEIILGLDPLKNKSDGQNKDNERIFEQEILSDSDCLETVNNEYNNYILSLNTVNSGFAEEAFKISVSSYTNYLSSEMVFGDIVDIELLEPFVMESFTLNFDLDEGENPEEYFIFKYSEDANTILPIKTIYDGNRLSTTDNSAGTYCLVNISEFEILENNNDYYRPENVYSTEEDSMQDKDVEVYFIMYSSSQNLDNVKSSVENASISLIDHCNKTNKNIKLYYSGYNGILSTDTEKKFLDNYSTYDDITSTVSMLQSPPLTLLKLANYPILKQINNTWNNYGKNSDDQKYYFIINAGTTPPIGSVNRVERELGFGIINPGWGLAQGIENELKYYSDGNVIIYELGDAQAKIRSIHEDFGVIFNLICDKENKKLNTYKTDILPAGEEAYYLTEDFSNIIFNEVFNNDFVITHKISTGLSNEICYDINQISEEWKTAYEHYYSAIISGDDKAKLLDEISKMGLPDTDGDGIYDCLEINMKYVSFDEEGNVILPTFSQLGGSGMDDLVEIMKKRGVDISSIRILPVLSNPTVDDSDGDGSNDEKDLDILKVDRILVLDEFIDDSNIFKSQTNGDDMIFDDSVISKEKVLDNNNLVAYKPMQVYKRFGDSQSISRFRICPEKYSDYKMVLSSQSENKFSVRIKDVTNPKKIKEIKYVKTTDNSLRSTYKFSLKSGRKYDIDIVFIPFTDITQNYSVSFEQDNWVYIENGGVAYIAECLEGIELVVSDYVEVYLTEDMLKQIVTHKFDDEKSAMVWDKNAINFNSICAGALKSAVYNENELVYLGINNSEYVWANDVSIYATELGVALLAFGTTPPFAVGAVVTITGGLATYISALSSNAGGFFVSVENTMDKINNQKDDIDELNIKLQRYDWFGVEKFNSYEWVNGKETYNYINKYVENDSQGINRYKCKLNIVEF